MQLASAKKLAALLAQKQAAQDYLMRPLDMPTMAPEDATAIASGAAGEWGNQLRDAWGMITSPVQTGKALWAAGKQLISDPVGSAKAAYEAEKERASGALTDSSELGAYAATIINPMRYAKALQEIPAMRDLTAYHGSPHRFEKFDASKIGTGEGAQAYGHGLYFAESPDVAKGYRNVLSDTLEAPESTPHLERRAAQMALTFGGNTPEGAIQWLSKFEGKGAQHTAPALTPELVSTVKSKFETGDFKQGGSLYTVDIPDSMIERMLDWDKPLSEQHPDVQKALSILDPYTHSSGRKMWGELAFPAFASTPTESHKSAAEWLRQNNIPGIKYFDAGSRDGGKGTRNFVVFPGEEEAVKILERK